MGITNVANGARESFSVAMLAIDLAMGTIHVHLATRSVVSSAAILLAPMHVASRYVNNVKNFFGFSVHQLTHRLRPLLL